jgi:preprotein translocase subunit SecE
MAKDGGAAVMTNKQPGMFDRLQQFFADVRAEMKKVNWPTKAEVKSMTQVVLVALLILAVIVAMYDWVFLRVIRLILLLS